MTSALQLSGITKAFGTLRALDGVDLTVRQGTTHALLGENGAGKSTLMHIIAGLLRPDAGSIAVDGSVHRLRSAADARALGIGLLSGVRAAYRGSAISPFVGFGLGLDVVGSDTSLGTFMGAGVDLLLHRLIALTAEAKFHRGWADNSYIKTLSFVAVGMGVEVRL